MNTGTTVSRISSYLGERRERRRRTRALRRELSSYTTQAEIYDILATMDRAEGPGVDTIRSILNEQAIRRHGARSSFPVAS